MDASPSAISTSAGDKGRAALVLIALEAVVESAVLVDIGLVHDHGLEADSVAELAVAEDVLHPAVEAALCEADALLDALAGLLVAEGGQEGAAAGDLGEVLARAEVDVDVMSGAAGAALPAVHHAAADGAGDVLVCVGDVVVPAHGACVVVASTAAAIVGSSGRGRRHCCWEGCCSKNDSNHRKDKG